MVGKSTHLLLPCSTVPDASAFDGPRGRCVVCDELLGTDPRYIVDLPDGEHVRCRDWTKHPFPYAGVLRDLRRRYRQIKREAPPEVRARVDELGRWLAERERMWPEGAVETMLESIETVDGVLAAGVPVRR